MLPASDHFPRVSTDSSLGTIWSAAKIFLQEVFAGIRVVRVFDATERTSVGDGFEWIHEHWRAKAKTVALHDLC